MWCFHIFLVPLENPYHPLKNIKFESVLLLQCNWISILELKTITFYKIKNKVKKRIIILQEPRIYATYMCLQSSNMMSILCLKLQFKLHEVKFPQFPTYHVVSPKNTIFINLRLFKVSKLYHLKLKCSILV
jgi:hypothetical protein